MRDVWLAYYRFGTANQENSDEPFWQRIFTENAFALSQVFSYPIVFVKGQAYVGGMSIDRKGARYVDYLLSREMSQEAVLIEIKTPTAKLLGGKYRGSLRNSSRELAGAIVQVLDYRSQLASSHREITKDTEHGISFFQPKCVLVIGSYTNELTDEPRRRAFELFRTQLKDVEIVTFDELFRKIEVLAKLFGVVRQHTNDIPAEE